MYSLTFEGMAGRDSDPSGEDGAGKVRYSSGLHDQGEHSVSKDRGGRTCGLATLGG